MDLVNSCFIFGSWLFDRKVPSIKKIGNGMYFFYPVLKHQIKFVTGNEKMKITLFVYQIVGHTTGANGFF